MENNSKMQIGKDKVMNINIHCREMGHKCKATKRIQVNGKRTAKLKKKKITLF